MKNIFITLLGFILFTWTMSSCEKIDLELDVPKCIERKISEIKKEDVRTPPTQVWEWKVDGKAYYYITSDCCDQFNYLYDDNCSIVCAPDGGLSGEGDGNCPQFDAQIQKTLIWQDGRE